MQALTFPATKGKDGASLFWFYEVLGESPAVIYVLFVCRERPESIPNAAFQVPCPITLRPFRLPLGQEV